MVKAYLIIPKIGIWTNLILKEGEEPNLSESLYIYKYIYNLPQVLF